MNAYQDPARTSGRQDTNLPSYQCASYVEALPDLQLVNDLEKGTTHIRRLGTKYLPQMPLETAAEYRVRRDRSVLFNVFPDVIKQLVGSKFRKDPTPDVEKAPDEIKEFFNDVDGLGTDLFNFLAQSDYYATRDGFSFIYVEIDSPPILGEDEESTLANDDRRPYLVHFQRDQMINRKWERIGSRDVLSQITFKIATAEDDGEFGEKSVTRYLVLRRGSWEEWEEKENTAIQKVREGFTGLDEIPLATHYGGKKTGELEATPPLLEVAHQIILHYQKLSDFDNWTHISCVPILMRKLNNADDTQDSDTVPIGPTVMVDVIGEHADLRYVEVSGAGLQITRDRIKDVERHIAKLSLEMYSPDHQTVRTATEIVSDRTQEMSALASAARSLTDAFAQAMSFVIQYYNLIRNLNLDEALASELQLNIDYDALTFNVQQLQFFELLVEKRYMSLKTFLAWLPKIASMPEGFNAESEIENILEEIPLRRELSQGLEFVIDNSGDNADEDADDETDETDEDAQS